ATWFLAIDDKILIGLRQLLERRVHINLLASTSAQQILLRFAHFLSAKDAHHALRDRERSVGHGAIQINRNSAPKYTAFCACAERTVETEKAWTRRPNVEIAVRTMPAGGKRKFLRSER